MKSERRHRAFLSLTRRALGPTCVAEERIIFIIAPKH